MAVEHATTMSSAEIVAPQPRPHLLLVVGPGRPRPDRHRPRRGRLPLHARGQADPRLQQPADVGEHRPRRPAGDRRDHGPGAEAPVRPAGLRDRAAGPARRQARRDPAGRPGQGVLHARRRRGDRERDQARPPLHRPAQDPRPLPRLPRRDARGDDADRRPAPLGQRARASSASSATRTPTAGARRSRGPSRRALQGLEDVIRYEGPHTIAAVFLETIVGTNGILIPPDGYIQGVREICDRYGILMVADEVMAGFGRTGRWFAVDHWDIVPDLMTMAKGLTSSVPAARRGRDAPHDRRGASRRRCSTAASPTAATRSASPPPSRRSASTRRTTSSATPPGSGRVMRRHHEALAAKHPSRRGAPQPRPVRDHRPRPQPRPVDADDRRSTARATR